MTALKTQGRSNRCFQNLPMGSDGPETKSISVFALWAGLLCGAEPARKRNFLGWFQTRDICDSAGTFLNSVIKCT